MARKSRNVCLVPPWWTQEEIQTRTCGDGSHTHIPRAEAATLIDWKEAEWIDGLADRVLRIKRIAKALRDKSAKIGFYLAKCVRQKKEWAVVMESLTHTHQIKKSKTKQGRGPQPRMKTFIPGTPEEFQSPSARIKLEPKPEEELVPGWSDKKSKV